MADNISTSVATDEIGGVHFQKVKMTHGGADTANDVTALTPLPVSIQNTSVEVTSASGLPVSIQNTSLDVHLTKPIAGAFSQPTITASTAFNVLTSNTERKGAIITNTSAAILYLRFDSTAPTSSVYAIAVPAGGSLVLKPGDYIGLIKGLLSTSATSGVNVTEFY